VSLHGASTLATDTAEVILMDESLNQLCRVFDIAREFNANMQMTMAAVFIPSILCVGGVLLGHIAFAQARVLNVVGLVTGVGAAMLPRLTHRTAPVLAAPATDHEAGTSSQVSNIWASAVNSTSTVKWA
jgi:cation transport ATPase